MASNDRGAIGRGRFGGGVANAQQTRHSAVSPLQSTRESTAKDKPGADPYNTSGSFDRSKNWSRVGKR